MSRKRTTFEALPYYDEDASNDPELQEKIKAEFAKERKKIGQRPIDSDKRIPKVPALFEVCDFPLFNYDYACQAC
jgi:hypothetical protein